MKRILITGANSFIGNSFRDYMKQYCEQCQIDIVDMKEESWNKKSFCGYDVVFHVAGIAHSDFGEISEDLKKYYYKINTNLAIEVASKAKKEGIKQFIFMSSAIVYGNSGMIGKERIITKNTPVNPGNFYSDSKVQAEKGIKLLEDEKFKICILRPPMIYGKGGKGNYPMLVKLALKLPVFPKVKNTRSMLYIGNLVKFVRLIIENEESGIFWPQNAEYSNTSELVKEIADVHGKKIILVPGCEWILKILSFRIKLINKAFGNFIYDQNMSKYKMEYRKFSLKESIEETER